MVFSAIGAAFGAIGASGVTTAAVYTAVTRQMQTLQKISANKVFDGVLTKYSFQSKTLGGLDANLNVFLPPGASDSNKVPVLYYLAGLTCTEDNGAQKGNFLETAAKEGIAVVFPDTSPRGAKIPGEDDSYDFGSGAGFYLNASQEPWSKNYKVRAVTTVEKSCRCELSAHKFVSHCS